MPERPFLITIDTEGDDLWAAPREITTRNARYLPRFQALCEKYHFRPVYLTNYEMAESDAFVEFGRDVLARGAGEIGMHLHAWNSPPLDALTADDFRYQPYLIEYPEAAMRAKITWLTRLLEDRFGDRMVSHRAGRWGFDGRYASMLLAEGYRVDCSVTPGVDWGGNRGDPMGSGGSDYRGFPERPYFLSVDDISRPAVEGLLEVPVTIRPSRLYRMAPCAYRIPLVRSVAWRISPKHVWVCPAESPLRGMLRAAHAARDEGATHIELALHSSELMPGGSPAFRKATDIERLYEHLEILFERLAGWCRGLTLREFYAEFAGRPER
ncbi:MAG TPA: hypothetical protein VGJ78_00975 [Vicinamibacterales bacterium]|jgi:hypothetical protein